MANCVNLKIYNSIFHSMNAKSFTNPYKYMPTKAHVNINTPLNVYAFKLLLPHFMRAQPFVHAFI